MKSVSKGQVWFNKAVAGLYASIGFIGTINACSYFVEALVKWFDQGTFATISFLASLHLTQAQAASGLRGVMLAIFDWLPAFVVYGFVGGVLLWGGLVRWVAADLPENSNT